MSIASRLSSIFTKPQNGKLDTSGGVSLLPSDAQILRALCPVEAEGAFFNGCSSLISAYDGLNRGRYAWSIVQAYYAYYYFMRVRLLLSRLEIFHTTGGSAGYIEIRSGAVPKRTPNKAGSSSHKAAGEIFAETFTTSAFVTQMVESKRPEIWLKGWREQVNYRDCRFEEPGIYDILIKPKSLGCRLAFDQYTSSQTYAFDPDHAGLALPTALMVDAAKSLGRHTPVLATLVDDASWAHLRRGFKDQAGPISGFGRVLNSAYPN